MTQKIKFIDISYIIYWYENEKYIIKILYKNSQINKKFIIKYIEDNERV